jgi:hypothetical protein
VVKTVPPLVPGLVLLAFVVAGSVLAVTVLPAGGHPLGGLLLGDTDLGPPWVAVALFAAGLWLSTRSGWWGRLGALVVILCALGYVVAQLSSVSTWFTDGRPSIGVFVLASVVAALLVIGTAAWALARSWRSVPSAEDGGGSAT